MFNQVLLHFSKVGWQDKKNSLYPLFSICRIIRKEERTKTRKNSFFELKNPSNPLSLSLSPVNYIFKIQIENSCSFSKCNGKFIIPRRGWPKKALLFIVLHLEKLAPRCPENNWEKFSKGREDSLKIKDREVKKNQ